MENGNFISEVLGVLDNRAFSGRHIDTLLVELYRELPTPFLERFCRCNCFDETYFSKAAKWSS